jgi:hypothetical protein
MQTDDQHPEGRGSSAESRRSTSCTLPSVDRKINDRTHQCRTWGYPMIQDVRSFSPIRPPFRGNICAVDQQRKSGHQNALRTYLSSPMRVSGLRTGPALLRQRITLDVSFAAEPSLYSEIEMARSRGEARMHLVGALSLRSPRFDCSSPARLRSQDRVTPVPLRVHELF